MIITAGLYLLHFRPCLRAASAFETHIFIEDDNLSCDFQMRFEEDDLTSMVCALLHLDRHFAVAVFAMRPAACSAPRIEDVGRC